MTSNRRGSTGGAAVWSVVLLGFAVTGSAVPETNGAAPLTGKKIPNSTRWTESEPVDSNVSRRPSTFVPDVTFYPDGMIPSVGPTVGKVSFQATAGACCVNSNCITATYTECILQGGYSVPSVPFCNPNLCTTGACCISGPTCDDDNGSGGPMTESLCGQIGGSYRGGASCSTSDLCGLAQPIPGFEIVEVAPTLIDKETGPPRLNDCGHIVFHDFSDPFEIPSTDVFLYENGILTEISNNPGNADWYPDISNEGVITWGRNEDGFIVGSGEIVLWNDGTLSALGPGHVTSINSIGEVVWYHPDPQVSGQTCNQSDPEAVSYKSDILLFDGETWGTRFNDGLSNQSARINDLSQVTWTNYRFPCGSGSGPWTSKLAFQTPAQFEFLPSGSSNPQLPSIDNLERVAWDATPVGLEMWQDAQTTVLTSGNVSAPGLSDSAQIAFGQQPTGGPWELWLYSAPTFQRISSQSDIDNHIDNIRPDMNAAGEIAWWWHPNGDMIPSGIRFMRRIRTGDYDLDGDVDRADFGKFTPCFTGNVPTDHLCQCRFLDIDHDRDVDFDDFSLFLSNYTGTIEDCNGNAVSDFDDILNAVAPDCNANGVPDSCDITGTASVDADNDGVPDECQCPVLQSVHVNPNYNLFNRKNRYISFTPRAAYWKPGTALIEPETKGVRAAIRVTLTSLDHYSSFNDQTRWVGPSTEYPDSTHVTGKMLAAKLQCTPHYQDWSNVDLLHVYGDAVIPNSTYDVQIIAEDCDGPLLNESRFSPPASIPTQPKWGDVVEPFGLGQPNFLDVSHLVSTFQNKKGAPIKSWGQLQPNTPNPESAVNFLDIATCVSAFQGKPYWTTFAGPSSCP